MESLPTEGISDELDFYKLNGQKNRFDDETSYISSEFGEESDEENSEDNVFRDIKKSVISKGSENNLIYGEGSVASQDRTGNDSSSVGAGHNSLTFGFIPKGCYTHPVKSGALLGICHNPRYRKFLMLDAKGITSWNYDCRTGPPVVRQLNYPSYQYRLYSNLIYDKKHNVYFCIGKDFSLKILNQQFQETYTVEANLHNVMFLLYNPKREELITGGVGGSKVWQFVQVVEDKGWTEVKAMSNYKLQHKYTLQNVGGGWVKKVTMDHKLSHLYCCSENDLHAYNLNNGEELFSRKRAHDMSITGCVYSTSAQYMVTSSNDRTVKCWIVNGGLVHVFRVHTKAVTQIMSHPEVDSLILSCSEDCSIKLLCLDTLNTLYSITVSSEGVRWMGLTHENLMWACTSRQVTMWNLNHFVDFLSLTRTRVHKLSLHSALTKSTRLLSVGDDSCIRLFSSRNRTHLCTILPMPCLSPLERVKCVAYSRELNLVYCLLNQSKLWIYTTRTDPACRIAQWDIRKIQDMIFKKEEVVDGESNKRESLLRKASPHRAVGEMHVNVEVCDCTAIATLNSHILLWGDEGWAGTVPTKFLLLGLTDGRVLFMDPFVRGLLHVDFRANKDAIREIRHDVSKHQLLTQCDRNEMAIVQFWGLPTLQLQHELCLYQDIVSSVRMDDTVFYGYSDGSVSFHTLEEVEDDNINRKTNQMKNAEELRLSGLVQKKVEHRASILSVDCCPRKQLFLTSSADMMIKIWSAEDECVIADVTLDETLSCAAFLNSSADIVFGFAKNLYTIEFDIICPSMASTDAHTSCAASVTAESDIYEDPSITNEGVMPNLEALDLRNYLKPFELDITKDFLEATDIVVRPQTREKVDEEESEIMSNAPTEVYESECSTPRLLRIEAFTPEPIRWDELSTHSGRASRAKSTDDEEEKHCERQAFFDKLDVTNPECAERYLPMFGESPGATPSISSAASVADSRSDLEDISDYEFGTEYGSDEDRPIRKQKSAKDQTSKGSKPLPQFSSKKKKGKTSDLVLTLAPDDPSAADGKGRSPGATKFGLDKMKVDVGALMKQGQRRGSKKVTVSTTPSQIKESVEDQLATRALKDALQAGASEISSKKKKAAGARKRAPAAVKKPSVPTSKKSSVAEVKSESLKPAPQTATQPAKSDKVSTVAGDLVSGLIPDLVAAPTTKKTPAKRKGKLIEAQTRPKYPEEMVKMPLDDQLPREQPDELEDDVDLANYMDMDDDMDCKSAASWNPKFDFERPDSRRKARAAQKSSSASSKDPRMPSAPPEVEQGLSQLGSPDSRLRVSVIGRTPALSERMSDMDGLSVQMDAYDDVEGRVTPQQSVSESAADQSTTRSGMSPIRLPNLLPELEESSGLGLPTQTDALSRWLMGSMPRAGSALESESHTRPGQNPVHVTIEDGSHASLDNSDAEEGRPKSAVAELSHSKMLGLRSRRPFTAPSAPPSSYEDLQEAFNDALLRFQGDTDINKLFRSNLGKFDEHWQDKLIERHKLLSMQKDIRAKSAIAKRQLLFQKMMEKRHALLGHRYCDGLIDELEEKPAPTPTPNKSTETKSRMNSAVSRPLISVSLSAHRARSARAVNAADTSSTKPLLEKANVMNETQVQYRFRINESSCEKLHSSLRSVTPLQAEQEPDSVTYDPRRPESVRRPGTRSIPSRCTRFVLVKQKKGGNRPTSPTPLEKQLLSKRFPNCASRIIPGSTRNRTIHSQQRSIKESSKISVPT